MARNTNPGPKADKLPVEKIPVEKLPSGSPVVGAIGPVPGGVAPAWTTEFGWEPWVYANDSFFMMADFNTGSGGSSIIDVAVFNGQAYLSLEIFDDLSWQRTWQSVTFNVATRQVSDSTLPDQPLWLTVAGEALYFWNQSISDPNAALGYLTAQGAMAAVPLPVEPASFQITWGGLYSFNDDVFVVGRGSGTEGDILHYDTATATWREYSLPLGSSSYAQYLLGATSDFLIVESSDANYNNIYSVNLATQSVELLLANRYTYGGSASVTTDRGVIVASVLNTLGGPAGPPASLVKIDLVSGSQTQLYAFDVPFVRRLDDEGDESFYLSFEGTTNDDAQAIVVRVDELTGTTTRFVLWAGYTQPNGAEIFNGELHVADDTGQIFRLDEASSTVQLVRDFSPGTPGYARIVGEVDGDLLVSAPYSAGDGSVVAALWAWDDGIWKAYPGASVSADFFLI